MIFVVHVRLERLYWLYPSTGLPLSFAKANAKQDKMSDNKTFPQVNFYSDFLTNDLTKKGILERLKLNKKAAKTSPSSISTMHASQGVVARTLLP